MSTIPTGVLACARDLAACSTSPTTGYGMASARPDPSGAPFGGIKGLGPGREAHGIEDLEIITTGRISGVGEKTHPEGRGTRRQNCAVRVDEQWHRTKQVAIRRSATPNLAGPAAIPIISLLPQGLHPPSYCPI